jgi:hypothetical protein
MMLTHLRLRRRVALLAAGVLEGPEREEVRAHAEACPRCRRALAEHAAVVSALAVDPIRSADPPVPASVMMDRVERELDRRPTRDPGPALGWRVALPAAAAALLALVLIGPEVIDRLRPAPPATAPDVGDAVPPEVLDRLERNLTREHTARYLSEAQDVLLSVEATKADCVRDEDRVDVGEAPDRSRELLKRRTLLVAGQPEAVASARAVLDDVELALREVADLPSCVRRRDVERLREQIEQRQLHMRIRLMTRELEG